MSFASCVNNVTSLKRERETDTEKRKRERGREYVKERSRESSERERERASWATVTALSHAQIKPALLQMLYGETLT